MDKETGKSHTHEDGYKPVLVREEVKLALQKFRRNLPDRDIKQERRLATAALELLLERADLHGDWMERTGRVALRDIKEAAERDQPVRLVAQR